MKRQFLLLAFLVASMGIAMAQKFMGGDISLLPKYEEKGATYFDKDGNKISDVLLYMKAQGMNSMRLRLFVDPSKAPEDHKKQGVCQDLDFVKKLGKRIKDNGLSLLLDLHYSDTWTDPGQHSVPAAWAGKGVTEMGVAVYDYTKSVLQEMKAYGAEPDFIQVGNEVTFGMLWETGHVYPSSADRWDNFTLYLKKGAEACREVCPKAGIVVHVELSGQGGNVEPFLQRLSGYSVDYDIIGLSYYPYFHGALSTLGGLLTRLESTYPTKKIQLVEAGYPHAYYPSDATFNYKATYPDTEEGQRKFTADLVALLNQHKQVNGFYWWWPEANEKGIDWQSAVTGSWYNCGLWDNATGKAMAALYELKAFVGDLSHDGIQETRMSTGEKAQSLYDLQGRSVTASSKGVLIKDGKKFIQH